MAQKRRLLLSAFLAPLAIIAIRGGALSNPQAPLLTLPFDDPEIVMTSGWVYDEIGPYFSNTCYCTACPFVPGQRSHKGIDFAKPPASPFDVVTLIGYVFRGGAFPCY